MDYMIWKYDAEWPAACFKTIDAHASVASWWLHWQYRFLRRLRTRFPRSTIRNLWILKMLGTWEGGNMAWLTVYETVALWQSSVLLCTARGLILPPHLRLLDIEPRRGADSSAAAVKIVEFQIMQEKSGPIECCALTVRILWKRENLQAGPNVFVPRKIRFDQFKRHVLILIFYLWRIYFWHTFVSTYDTALLV